MCPRSNSGPLFRQKGLIISPIIRVRLWHTWWASLPTLFFWDLIRLDYRLIHMTYFSIGTLGGQLVQYSGPGIKRYMYGRIFGISIIYNVLEDDLLCQFKLQYVIK